METKHNPPPRWALALVCLLAVVQLVALPFVPEGWPLMLDFALVYTAARLAWRAWPLESEND